MTLSASCPTVLVAAEPTFYCTGLVSLLQQQWPTSTITLTADASQVIDLVRTQLFQLLILDTQLPKHPLPTLLNHLKQARPTQKIALLADKYQPSPAASNIPQLIIAQHTTPGQLAAVLSPLFNSPTYQNTLPRAHHPVPIHFSSRELEVLRLVADDHCNQEIADQLYLSVRTIESHRRALLQKSGSRTLAGLVAWALRAGMVA